MEMENEAQEGLSVPLVSGDDDPTSLNDTGSRMPSSLDDDVEKDVQGVDDAHPKENGALTALSLAMIIFYNASGGPFGTEPSVKAAGNFYAIIGLALMPILWAIPEVFMTYKLSTKHPCSSGGALWIELAFGERTGLLVGYLGWLGGVVMAASYPALLYEYVMSQFFPDKGASEVNPLVRYGSVLSLAVVLSAVNYRGLSCVGRASTLMYVLTMSPFVIMVVVGLAKADPSKWLETPSPNTVEVFDDDSIEKETQGWLPIENLAGIAFGPFINNLYWNFNNFDQAGHYSTSVSKSVFKKGLAGSLVLVASAYLLPILAATGATNLEQDDWKPGSLAVAGSEIVGNWLGVWIVISSGISLASCFFAEISADSLQLLGMADRRRLPKILSHKSHYDTPTYSILLCLVVIASVLPFDFGVITELCNMGYCLSVSIEFMAFVQLQIRHGDESTSRKLLYTLMLIPPMTINIMIILLASVTTYIYVAVMIVVGMVLIHAAEIKKFFCRRKDEANDGQPRGEAKTVLL